MKMKYIKTINEMFDDAELKSRFELSYIDGSLKKSLSEWEPINLSGIESGTRSFLKKITFNHPVILDFLVIDDYEDDGVNFITLGIDNGEVGTNLKIGYSPENGEYYVFYIITNLADHQRDYINKMRKFSSVKGALEMVSNYLNICIDYDLVSSDDKWNPIFN